MTEPKRMVPIEEAIEAAEAEMHGAWNRAESSESFVIWLNASERHAELRALAASGATEVEEP